MKRVHSLPSFVSLGSLISLLPHKGESSLDEAAAVRPGSVTGLSLQGGSLQAAPVMLRVLQFLEVHLFSH